MKVYKPGDLVILRSDKIYAKYGKRLDYYVITDTYDDNLIRAHNTTTKDIVAVFSDDIILLSNI